MSEPSKPTKRRSRFTLASCAILGGTLCLVPVAVGIAFLVTCTEVQEFAGYGLGIDLYGEQGLYEWANIDGIGASAVTIRLPSGEPVLLSELREDVVTKYERRFGRERYSDEDHSDKDRRYYWDRPHRASFTFNPDGSLHDVFLEDQVEFSIRGSGFVTLPRRTSEVENILGKPATRNSRRVIVTFGHGP